MGNIQIPELETIIQKLELIEKMVTENSLPKYLPAKMVAQKLGMTTQTLSSIATKGIIKKHHLGDRRIFYCIPEIYEAIHAGAIKPFNPKTLKR
jgi:hypothetical protein